MRLGQEHGLTERQAECLWQLASLADSSGDTCDAVHWAVLSHLSGGAGGRARALLLTLAQRFGVDTLEAAWIARSGEPLPTDLVLDLADRIAGRWRAGASDRSASYRST